ncbi:hypothetical protein TRVA0_001S02674 [Trichomonascus vanleenenianus]|uniref:Mrx15p n=1 Tax=Trichomonascus vanleenenianus TaxID=2268995 RepID=UPI003ECA87DC
MMGLIARPLRVIKPLNIAPTILTISKRFNSSLPKSVDGQNLESNELKSRIPKFPFHKDIAPTIIPKNTPRVSKTLSFKQLMEILYASKEPELVYMAESHRLYFLACMALTFVACYNLFDLLDRGYRGIGELHAENEDNDPTVHNAMKTSGRVAMVAGLSAVYLICGITFAIFPTRLVRRIEFLPGAKEHIRFVTHPWFPGRKSPVITVPLENLSIGKRTKVWTGSGFYGTAQRSSFFFFLFEKGKLLPWVVDRNGWYWGDGRVYDVLFGKETVEFAEKGLSYDDVLMIQHNKAQQKKAELRRQLGPAWRMKVIGEMMKEDAQKVANKARGIGSSSKPGHKAIKGEEPPKDETK